MRQILLFAGLIAIALAAGSCDNKDDKNKLWDPNAMVSLRAAKNVRSEVNPQHLTAREIVELTNAICWYYEVPITGRGFADTQRDFVNERLLMWGDDIINSETGALNNSFIGGEDIVLERIVNLERDIVDTIAYISNSTLRIAETAIREAYGREDYTAVYKLFDTAFTFIPITGPEWRELKAKGQN